MSEYLMIMAYLPWIRLQADRFLLQALHRTKDAASSRIAFWNRADTAI
jgi:hypothetical protein